MAAVSVAVASFRERRLLDACLESLARQSNPAAAAIVVARDGDEAETAQLERDWPGVTFARAERGASVPRLRGLALGESTGHWVLLTEDHCVAAPDWIERLLAARADADVVGGSMDNRQTERALDWGATFAEYGFFGAGAGNGPFMPTGANVAYTRDVAAKVSEWCSAGLWENVAHGRLLEQGARFRFEPAATVYQNKNYRFAAFCRDRFEHGLSYARRRVVDEGAAKRWFYLLTSPLLPWLLTKRVGQACWTRHARPFVRALPFTFTFLAAWSLGEAVGYLTGSAASRGRP
jgi:GT2 family glycosyltransferase